MTTSTARTLVVAAVVMLVGGIAAAVVGVVHIAHDVVHTVAAPASPLPAMLHRDLDAGDYDIYQLTATRSGGGGFSFSNNQPVTLTPANVSVVGPDGARLGVGPVDTSETLTRSNTVYTAAVRFTVLTPGTYDVFIDRPFSGGGDQVILTKSFGTVARNAVRWVLLVLLGGAIALGAIVMLIVVFVRSRRRPAATTPVYVGAGAPMAPPGWYPDPSGRAPHRWWDGSAWTDHVG